MIPQHVLHKLVEKMEAEIGSRGIETMCAGLGIELKDICDTITRNFGPPDGTKRSPAQLALDFLMLGAAIGYMFAKGDNINGYDSIV